MRKIVVSTVTPLGEIYLAADSGGLTDVWFADSRYLPDVGGMEKLCGENAEQPAADCLRMAVEWLEGYFNGDFSRAIPRLNLRGTDFRKRVWDALSRIEAGCTVNYAGLAVKAGFPPGSARAVGSAVAHNPALIFVPCHRVVRGDGTPGGFAAGLWRKLALLSHERNAEGK